ncbi:MAG TPA: hypothetical protein VMM35_03590 [Longimicrobiales bacterium]|nr:hypothetical protein [Longimicrobiales bacterium]
MSAPLRALVLGACAVLSFTPAAAQVPPCDEAGWEAVLSAHFEGHRLLAVEDVYKLLHQGVFGSEHAAPDVASASAMLEQEIATLGRTDGGAEPLVEPIAPDGRVVRVHLRPYLAMGGDPERLLVAFLETAASVRGSTDELRCAAEVVDRLAAGRWSAGEWRAFLDRMIAARLPAIHHSEPFEGEYQPAYRVVAGDLLPLLGMPGR